MAHLSTFLAFRYLESNLNPTLPRDEIDLAAQELEYFLSGDPEDETGLLLDYTALPGSEFQDLAPHLHEWFLERISLHPEIGRRLETTDNLARAFFLDSSPTIPYLTVCALVEVYRSRERRETSREEPSPVSGILSRIANAVSAVSAEQTEPPQEQLILDRAATLMQLAEILMDLYYLADPSTTKPILESLRQLNRVEDRVFYERFKKAIVERSEQLPEDRRNEFASFL